MVSSEWGPPFQLNELATTLAAEQDSLPARIFGLSTAEVNAMLDDVEDFLPEWEGGCCPPYESFTPATLDLYANACMDEAARHDWPQQPSVASVRAAKRQKHNASQAVSVSTDTTLPDGDAPPLPRKRTMPPLNREVVQEVTAGTRPATPAMLSREAFVEFQLTDSFCTAVTRTLNENALPQDSELALHLMMNREWYNIEPDGLLVHFATSHPKRGQVLRQWVVPTALRPLVLRLGHDDATAGHAGVTATHLRLFERYFWPMMQKDVRTYVMSCMACLERKKASTGKAKQMLTQPTRLFQRAHTDICMASVTSKEGHIGFLTVIEARSGFAWVFPIKDKTKMTAARLLYRVFLEAGTMIRELVSDQGKEFLNDVIQDLCALFAVKKIDTSAYHPQSNGIAERRNEMIMASLTTWVNAKQDNWHEGLEAVQFVLRATPREDTGLSPFFCVYGREPSLPHDAFMHEDRPMDLHAEIERNMQNLRLAEKVVDEAFGRKAARIERANEAVKRAMRVSVGDLVMIRMAPAKGRSKKLDPKFTGPWQVMEAAGDSGLSFSCRMMGRRIRRTKAHVTNMKPFHLRPAHLDNSDPHAMLTEEQVRGLPHDEWLYRIVDRRANPNGSWDYRWITRAGALSDWKSEDDTLEVVMPWTLDTFHALYEMRHANDMPDYAARAPPAERKGLSKDAALALVPMGTQVVREHRDSVKQGVSYIWGAVMGYQSPYWRVKYEDGEWEECTRKQLLSSVALAQALRKRAVELGATDPRPTLTQVMAPVLPPDFGEAYLKQTVRVKNATGWSRGQLVEYLPRAGKHTFKVQFNGCPAGQLRTVKLRPDYYMAATDSQQAENCPMSSWNLLLTSVQTAEPETLDLSNDSADAAATNAD